VHENVRLELARLNETTRNRDFYLLDKKTATEIERTLETIYTYIEASSMEHWRDRAVSTGSFGADLWTSISMDLPDYTLHDARFDGAQLQGVGGIDRALRRPRQLLPPELTGGE
jgi:hypothetical protein